MVNIGDTVLVTLRAYEPGIALFENNREYLQSRLQTAGFRVVSLDDSGLSWMGTEGDLLVSVQPLTSAYAHADDVGSIVAGAAYTAGYRAGQGGMPQLLSSRVVALAQRAYGLPNSSDYEHNVNRQNDNRNDDNDDNNKIPDWVMWAGVGLITALAIVSFSGGGGGRRR